MNAIDIVLILLLLTAVVIGSKKGLVREASAFTVFFVATIVCVAYVDGFAVWVHSQVGGSPLTSALIAFVVLLATSYGTFKLLGYCFYKVANVKSIGNKDQMGGALVGFLRGWLAVGFLTMLVFLLPLPDSFYDEFEGSFFGPTIAKTVPIMFEGTARLHPGSPSFMDKMEQTLLIEPSKDSEYKPLAEHRQQAHKVLYQMERFFNPGLSGKS